MSTKSTKSPRRLGAETSATRAALLDAAEELMLEGGYAAVTSRRLAARAELKPQLVHYYFRTMDDLFLALFRRGAERNLERQRRALASAQPLRALWDFSTEPAGTALMTQFMAMATHRPAIRDEVAAYARQFRAMQAEALAGVLHDHGIDAQEIPAVAVLLAASGLSRSMVMEAALGMTVGHAETRALVERLLTRMEGPGGAEPPGRAAGSPSLPDSGGRRAAPGREAPAPTPRRRPSAHL